MGVEFGCECFFGGRGGGEWLQNTETVHYSAWDELNRAAVVPFLELLYREGAGEVAKLGRLVDVDVFPFTILRFGGT